MVCFFFANVEEMNIHYGCLNNILHSGWNSNNRIWTNVHTFTSQKLFSAQILIDWQYLSGNYFNQSSVGRSMSVYGTFEWIELVDRMSWRMWTHIQILFMDASWHHFTHWMKPQKSNFNITFCSTVNCPGRLWNVFQLNFTCVQIYMLMF